MCPAAGDTPRAQDEAYVRPTFRTTDGRGTAWRQREVTVEVVCEVLIAIDSFASGGLKQALFKKLINVDANNLRVIPSAVWVETYHSETQTKVHAARRVFIVSSTRVALHAL